MNPSCTEKDPPQLDQIEIKDLHLRCMIGIQDWERQTLQDVIINITLFVDLTQAGRSDKIEDTINYKILTKQIIAMVEKSAFFLVEALATQTMAICLQNAGVYKARVSVEKPDALRFARSVGVVIERDQNWWVNQS